MWYNIKPLTIWYVIYQASTATIILNQYQMLMYIDHTLIQDIKQQSGKFEFVHLQENKHKIVIKYEAK